MIDFKLTFVNSSTKDIFNVIVHSKIKDAYVHEQGYLEMINTEFPDINWLTLLAERKLSKKLNSYNLDSVIQLNY